MIPTIQIESIVFDRDEKAGTDGAVYYLILYPCEERPCTHVCASHPERTHCYERQAFRLGKFGHRLDGTPKEIKEDCANVWGWDGNREAPTLRPSFLGKRDRYRIHLHLTAGKIDLCGDSTLVLAPNPVPCRDRDDWKTMPAAKPEAA
jgi:hypothetical protein